MRQLAASESSNDEMERIKFAIWFEGKYRNKIKEIPVTAQMVLSAIAWEAWQAALKNKRE